MTRYGSNPKAGHRDLAQLRGSSPWISAGAERTGHPLDIPRRRERATATQLGAPLTGSGPFQCNNPSNRPAAAFSGRTVVHTGGDTLSCRLLAIAGEPPMLNPTKQLGGNMMVGAKPYGQLRYRNVNGKRMVYVDEGQGDAIVFQHGNPVSSAKSSPMCCPDRVARSPTAVSGSRPLVTRSR